jgi:hypothetical protein
MNDSNRNDGSCGGLAVEEDDGRRVMPASHAGVAARASARMTDGMIVGELVALSDGGTKGWVTYSGQPSASAMPALSVVELRGRHIGSFVVLMFDRGNPERPVIMGLLTGAAGWPSDHVPAEVEVDADGDRMVVRAREQLVLQCGKASITLTRAGKVLIHGTYVSSRSTGVNRIKGGAIQLN